MAEHTGATIRVLIADDHPVVRAGVRSALAPHPDLEVIGEAADGDEAFQMTLDLQPDVLLLDLNMPGVNHYLLIRELQAEARPGAPHILILTVYADSHYVLEMLEAGATGYIVKDEDLSVLAEGIRAVTAGRIWVSTALIESLPDQTIPKPPPVEDLLSAREWSELRLIAQGFGNAEIAVALGLAQGTIKNQVSRIYAKQKVTTRPEAVAWAWKRRLLDTAP